MSHRRRLVPLIVWPTSYEDAVIYQDADRCAARVLEVNNDRLFDTGLVRSGKQTCTLELLGGRFKGQTTEGYNLLNGSLESDKIFQPGDKALVVIEFEGEAIRSVNMIDHYRINVELILALCFMGILILFAGKTGIRAVLSFAITVLMIWKILVPAHLKGWDPIWIGMLITLILTILIIALVYGFDRRALSAISGATIGLLVTCLLEIIFTDSLKIHGAVNEVVEKRPDIG